MAMKTQKQLITSASALSLMALFAACSSGEADDGSGGMGGSGGKGTGGAASGGAGTGGKGTGGKGSGGAATGGADCAPPEGSDFTIWHPDGGEGGAGGATPGTSFLCYPNVVCVSPDVPSPEFSPAMFAYAHVDSSYEGAPRTSSANGEPDVVITHPEPGRVCIKGSDGARLSFQLGDPAYWDGEGEPLPAGVAPVPWDELAITRVRFTIETPPASGVSLQYLTFSPCDLPTVTRAENEGNPLILTTDDATITLSLASDFDGDIVLTSGNVFEFLPGKGEYDYCIKDLEFLDKNGDPVD